MTDQEAICKESREVAAKRFVHENAKLSIVHLFSSVIRLQKE